MLGDGARRARGQRTGHNKLGPAPRSYHVESEEGVRGRSRGRSDGGKVRVRGRGEMVWAM